LRRLQKSFQSIVQEARGFGSGYQYKGYYLVGAEGFEYQARSAGEQQGQLRRHWLLKGSAFGGGKPRSGGV
jgi:hypothetical protein